MSNREVATRNSGYLADSADYFDMLANEARGLKGGGDGKAFMKFDGNTGDFMYGADDEDLPLGSEMAVNMRSYMRGWVIWVDGEVVHEEMTPLGTPAPTKASLPDHGPYGEDDGPVEQYVLDFKMMDEPHVEMVFQANNASKRRAIAALLKDFSNTYKAHPGEVPIVKLDEREFEAKTKGGKGRKVTKHAPSFKIVDWVPEDEVLALSGEDPEGYDEPAPRQVEDRSSRRGRDDDERPARGRSRDRDDEPEPRSRRDRDDRDDEPAARGRGRGREEEPAPRSRRDREDAPTTRRAAREEPPEDDRPARRSRAEADDDAPPRRSAREEPPEDDRPARRSARDEAPADDEPAPAERPRRAARDEAPADDERPARRGRDDDAPAPRRGRY